MESLNFIHSLQTYMYSHNHTLFSLKRYAEPQRVSFHHALLTIKMKLKSNIKMFSSPHRRLAKQSKFNGGTINVCRNLRVGRRLGLWAVIQLYKCVMHSDFNLLFNWKIMGFQNVLFSFLQELLGIIIKLLLFISRQTSTTIDEAFLLE